MFQRFLFWVLITAPVCSVAQQFHTLPIQDQPDVYQRLGELEAQVRELKDRQGVQPAGFGEAPPCPDCFNAQPDCICGSKWAAEDYVELRLTGFFHLDSGWYGQDTNNRNTLGDIEDGLGFRRARLAGAGKVAERTSFIMEFDFAQAQARFVDVWMQFEDRLVGDIRIGRYRQPFGMSELTSVRELPFLERPLTFALAPFRQTGIMFSDKALNERMTWALSGYRFLSDNFGNVYSDTGGYGMATRVTFLPIDCGNDRLVHVGADFSHNDPGGDVVQFVSTNEFFVGQQPALGPAGLSVLPIVAVPPFVNTGAMPTERTNLLNVEGAVSFGRLVVQSEARWAIVDQTNGVSNTFPGAYLHVRYVLSGETIPYKRKAGAFGRIKPLAPVDLFCGQWGAWEIAARVSYLDLNGTSLPGPGRRITDTTLGLNWYVSKHTKFQLNWIHSDLSDPTLGDSNADTLALRGQLDF